MLDGVDALIALEKFGTVSEAAVRLRLTQSAVSKRIRSLEQQVGFRLVEQEGRRLRLTPAAVSFLERARPLVADLRALTGLAQDGSISDFSIALADSIASSWGPEVIKRTLRSLPGINVRLHAHRSVLVVESVRLGRYHIGMCTDLPEAKDLIHHGIADEPLVLVNSGMATKPARGQPLISIEPGSATWRAIEPQLRTRHPELLARTFIPVETFSATVQMVKAGFGDGLVPLGLAAGMGLDRRCYRELSAVKRYISLVTRKTVNQLATFRRLREQLVRETAGYLSKAAVTARV
ncbi:MAG: LysR family transcriptional regulator [Betaproteobacteria bacterium]